MGITLDLTNVLLVANNPVYRGETIGSYAFLFNAIVNLYQLAAAHRSEYNSGGHALFA